MSETLFICNYLIHTLSVVFPLLYPCRCVSILGTALICCIVVSFVIALRYLSVIFVSL